MTSATQPAPPTVLDEPRFSTKEAATRLRCSTKTILTRIGDGRIAPVIRNAKRGPGSIEIPESSIRAFELRALKGVAQ